LCLLYVLYIGGIATIEATEAALVKFQGSEGLTLNNSISNIANNLRTWAYTVVE